MSELPDAEDLNYWQTSQRAADVWMDMAKREIENAGGEVLGDVFANQGGRSAYMVEFRLAGERYRIVWPVLPSRTGKERAARVQAATLLYHDIKARVLTARVLGARAAFLTFLLLPDGRSASEAAAPALADAMPRLLAAPKGE